MDIILVDGCTDVVDDDDDGNGGWIVQKTRFICSTLGTLMTDFCKITLHRVFTF